MIFLLIALTMTAFLTYLLFRASTHYGVSGSLEDAEADSLRREALAARNELLELRERHDDLMRTADDIRSRLPRSDAPPLRERRE